MVVNSHHFKQVPGRQTDVKDAQWLAELLSYGLVRGSMIPPLPPRDLRDLTRATHDTDWRTRQCEQSLAESVGMGKSQTGVGGD